MKKICLECGHRLWVEHERVINTKTGIIIGYNCLECKCRRRYSFWDPEKFKI